MGYKVFGDTIAMRLEIGEEILESIANVCRECGFDSAVVTGIGATDYARIGAGNELKDEYETTEYTEKMEIVNLTGDVVMKEGKHVPHIHVVLAGPGGRQLVGGHLERATIFSTAEIFIRKLDGVIEKQFFPQHGWWLMGV